MADDAPNDPRDRLIEELRKENAELKRQLAEALRKLEEATRAQKRQAAPFSKGPPKANPKPRGRKPGEDYGVHAHREAPPQVDEVIPVSLPPRCSCGGHLEFDETVAQYQTEIPRKPIYRRFDIDVGRCRDCGKRVQGRHPLQTSDAIGAAAPQLGPDAQAMTAMLKDDIGVSYGDVSAVLEKFFRVPLSRGGAARIVLRVAQRVEAAYHGIQIVVRRSKIVYPDETGWKVAGVLQWMWVFVTRTATLFRIRPSRGFDVPEEVLGARWNGKMIHDGWSVYERFWWALHQQCLGHIQRRCENILESAVRGAVRFPRAVLQLIGDAFGLRDRRDAGEVSTHGVAVAIGRLHARLLDLLNWSLSNKVNARLAKHLANHQDQLFLFLKYPSIEATSWPADHAIRPAVSNRKIFGGNRDPAGAHAQEVLSSIEATCDLREVSMFEYLSQVIRAAAPRRDALACRLLGLPQPR